MTTSVVKRQQPQQQAVPSSPSPPPPPTMHFKPQADQDQKKENVSPEIQPQPEIPIPVPPLNPDSPSHAVSPGAVPEMPGSILRYTPLADISSLPTLFPAPIATLITTMAISTRMTLKVTAFLVEAILETSQYSTRMSLGYLRRLLITAISSARRVYLMSTAAIEIDLLSLMSGGDPLAISSKQLLLKQASQNKDKEENKEEGEGDQKKKLKSNSILPSSEDFLTILDRYTNLGIYFIHHTFTMVELFTMSGFFLTTSLIKSAHTAAIESVILFDSLFGSNESSRTLSAIITMVRKEILQDDRINKNSNKKDSTISTLTSLTKALTAFACLQVATWKRTSRRMKMTVLFDCIVENRQEDPLARLATNVATENPQAPPVPATEEKTSTNAEAGPGPSTMEARKLSSAALSSSPALEEADEKLLKHAEGIDSYTSNQADWSMGDSNDPASVSSEITNHNSADEDARQAHDTQKVHTQSREVTLEVTEELREKTIVTQLIEQVKLDSLNERRPHRTIPTGFKHKRQLSLPEMPFRPLNSIHHENKHTTGSAITSLTTSPRQHSELPMPSTQDDEEGSDDNWIEIDDNDSIDSFEQIETPSITSSPSPEARSTGIVSHLDTPDGQHPNVDSTHLVVKTITDKVFQRKRTVKHVIKESLGEGVSDNYHSRTNSTKRSRGGRRGAAAVDRYKGARFDPVKTVVTPLLPALSENDSPIPSYTPSNPLLSRPRHVRHLSADAAMDRANGILPFATRALKPLTPFAVEKTSGPDPNSEVCNTDSIQTDSPPAEPLGSSPFAEGIRAPPSSPYQYVTSKQPLPDLNTSSMQQSDPALLHTQEAKQAAASSVSSSIAGTETPTTPIVTSTITTDITDQGEANPGNLFPHESLVPNIHRYMRYASAAYGQNFLRILGLGSSEFMFPNTGKHHANSWAFAQHTKLPINSLLLSSFTESSATLIQQEAPPLIHYVAVDHTLSAIILTCRGTLGLSDILVDLTCEYQSIHVEEGDPEGHFYVHAGMWQSARKLTVKQSTVHETLVKALTDHPTYGLVLTGHSLGGGVASLLGILCSMPSHAFLEKNALLKKSHEYPKITTPFVTNFESGLPPGRPIHVYAYGPPAVTSIDLSRYCKGLITSVVQDSDIVPTLSLGGIKDFKNIALTLNEESGTAEEIVGRVIGYNRKKFEFQKNHSSQTQTQLPQTVPVSEKVSQPGPSTNYINNTAPLGPPGPDDQELLSDWMVSLIKTMRADMDNEKLYPPGSLYILEHFDVYVTDDRPDIIDGQPVWRENKKIIHKQAHRVILRQCDSVEERFREPIFAKSMLQNHLPSQYEKSTQLLFESSGQGKL